MLGEVREEEEEEVRSLKQKVVELGIAEGSCCCGGEISGVEVLFVFGRRGSAFCITNWGVVWRGRERCGEL